MQAVRAAIAEIDPRAALAEVQPMQAFVDRAMAPIRFTSTLIGIFGAVAVLLAGIGLYGVLATIVRQRTAEIGMRMVFGAPRSSILNLVVGEGLKLSAAGVVIGVAAALMLTRVMASMLVGVESDRPAHLRRHRRALRRYRGCRVVGAGAPGRAARSDAGSA